MTTRALARTGMALVTVAAVAALWSGNIAAQSESPAAGAFTYEDMTVGFIQTGSESGWRAANTASFKETAEQLGIDLKFYDAQNKLENQVSAFHQFNQDPAVNVIILAALDVTGYDEVLQEAKDNGKIVVLEDRRIDADPALYATYIGSDFDLEGQKAAAAMCDLLADSENKKIVEITGAVGASAAIDRAKGFREAMGDCGIEIIDSQTGNWGVAESKAVMEAFLKNHEDIAGRLRPQRRGGHRRHPGDRGGRPRPRQGHQGHRRRRDRPRLRVPHPGQDQRPHRVQPAPRAAGLRGGAGGDERRQSCPRGFPPRKASSSPPRAPTSWRPSSRPASTSRLSVRSITGSGLPRFP